MIYGQPPGQPIGWLLTSRSNKIKLVVLLNRDWVTTTLSGPAWSGLGALDGRFPSFDECGQTFLLLVENSLSTLL